MVANTPNAAAPYDARPDDAGTMFAIELPNGSGGKSIMLMDALGGRDQIVATAVRSSWLEFERPLPAMFHAWVARDPGVVIDVGANTGFYACLAFFASPKARVRAGAVGVEQRRRHGQLVRANPGTRVDGNQRLARTSV